MKELKISIAWGETCFELLLGPLDSSCIWLILNEAHAYYDTTAGCYLETPVKDGCIQKLDSVYVHSDSEWLCDVLLPWLACPEVKGLNLKVGKGNYWLGKPALN